MTGNKIKHIVASGCSYTAGSIGGVPPCAEHPDGGNSYTYNPEMVINTWAAYVAKELNSSSFVNLATGGRGNYHTYLTLLHILTDDRYFYNKDNTLVLFNISDIWRLDIPVHITDPTSQHWWSEDIIPFGFMHDPSNVYKSMQQEQVEMVSLFAIRSLIDFLEINKFEYRFTLLTNSIKDQRIKDLVENNKNLVLTPEIGMWEFCKKNNLYISENDQHPTIEGHAEIGKIVLDKLI